MSQPEPEAMISPNRSSTPALPKSGRSPLADSTRVLALGLMLALLACGGSSGGGARTVPVSFGVSDTPVEGLVSVVITIDRITLERRGGNDVVIERFTSEELGVVDEDTITIDLLDYRGEDNLLIAGPVQLGVGDYQNLRLEILDEDVALSYAEELGGAIVPIKVPSNELKLGGFEVEDSGDQTFILEFGLRFAMTYNPGPDRYILKPRGIRIVEVSRGTTLEGIVATDLFTSAPDCDAKAEPLVGNVAYVYRGIGLDPAELADAFDPLLDPVAAAAFHGPYASETVAADGSYLFAYLPAGDYTLAFSCDAVDDGPEFDDDILVPSPEEALTEVSTLPGESWRCDFPVPASGCERLEP
jgi:hypothetical protein